MIHTEMRHVACFSGYRSEKLALTTDKHQKAYFVLRESIGKAVIQAVGDGYVSFMCGMATGFDLIAGSVFLELREKRSDMAEAQLVAVLPFDGHGFSDPWRVVHQMVLGRADEVVTLAAKYHRQVYHDRNRYMVDHSSRLICYYDGQKGGTAYTVKYAYERGLTIVNVAEPKSGF